LCRYEVSLIGRNASSLFVRVCCVLYFVVDLIWSLQSHVPIVTVWLKPDFCRVKFGTHSIAALAKKIKRDKLGYSQRSVIPLAIPE
jgi:hypothetical protein